MRQMFGLFEVFIQRSDTRRSSWTNLFQAAVNIKTPPARRKQREERVVDRATDSFQMDKEISLGVDKEKSLKWNMNNSPKTNKEKSSKTNKGKSLETLWQEVQALDSSPRRPSSLSTQVYISLTNAMQYMKVAPSSGIYPIVYSSKQEYNISYQSSGPDFSKLANSLLSPSSLSSLLSWLSWSSSLWSTGSGFSKLAISRLSCSLFPAFICQSQSQVLQGILHFYLYDFLQILSCEYLQQYLFLRLSRSAALRSPGSTRKQQHQQQHQTLVTTNCNRVTLAHHQTRAKSEKAEPGSLSLLSPTAYWREANGVSQLTSLSSPPSDNNQQSPACPSSSEHFSSVKNGGHSLSVNPPSKEGVNGVRGEENARSICQNGKKSICQNGKPISPLVAPLARSEVSVFHLRSALHTLCAASQLFNSIFLSWPTDIKAKENLIFPILLAWFFKHISYFLQNYLLWLFTKACK